MYDSPSSRFVIPSAALDLSCRRENSTYEEVRHSKSYKVRCLPLPSLLLSDRCARKISRFARNDNTGKAVLSFSTYLRRLSPRGKGFRTSPSFLWKEVPRRGRRLDGGKRDEKERGEIVSSRQFTKAPERHKKEANPASLRSAAPSKGRG